MNRFLGILFLILAVIALTLTPAYADPNYQSNTQTVWVSNTSSDCHKTQATAQSGYEDYWSTSVMAQAGNMSSGTCVYNTGRQVQDGYLAAFMQLWVWDDNQWDICQDSGSWSYSNAYTSGWQISWSGGYGPCGAGYYGTMGFSSEFDDGAWQGYQTGVWSGYVWLNQDPNVQGATALANRVLTRSAPNVIIPFKAVPKP